MIDECKDLMSESIRSSTLFYFENNTFFGELPPRLRNKLVQVVLYHYIRKFKFFFQDYINQIRAPQDFMVRMMTSLDSQLYKPGALILESDQKVDNLILIAQGKCFLNGFIRSGPTGTSDTVVTLVKLIEGSWYGDFNILLDVEMKF